MEGMFVVLMIISVAIVVAAMRKATSAVATKPSRLRAFALQQNGSDVLKQVIAYAQVGGYKIEDIDEAIGRVILSDSVSLTSFGFFYPVYISQHGDETVVEVGIKPRLPQVGPIVTRNLERCVNGLKAHLIVESSR
jgi:hypothetical protein